MGSTLPPYLTQFLLSIVLLVGFVLLVKQKRIGWAIIFIVPILYYILTFLVGFAPLGPFSKIWIYQIATIFFCGWGFIQWRDKKNNVTSKNDQNEILDDFGTTISSTTIYQANFPEKKQLLIIFTSFLVLLTSYGYFFEYIKYPESFFSILPEALTLTGVYSLTKYCVDGWFFLVIASAIILGIDIYIYLESSVLYVDSGTFQLYQISDITQLIITLQGYYEWKKFATHSK